MFKKLYQSFWQVIDPMMYTAGTCGAFGVWISIF